MAATFGDMLRLLRETAGLSHTALAARAHASPATIGHVETGRRRPTPEIAAACDAALGTAPLLAVLHDLDGSGDNMRRRALLKTAGAVAATGGMSGVMALAEVVRAGLMDVADQPDWDATVADHARRLVIDPDTQYGAGLLASLMLAGQAARTDKDAARAAAQMAQLYGLWQGDQGALTAARGWYRSAAALADHAGDTAVGQWVRARAASRAILEGYTVRETVADAQHALSLTAAPTVGALEARSALVHVHGLTGQIAEARAEVEGMRRIVDRLGAAGLPGGAHQRTLTFHHWVECRTGRLVDAERAWDEAGPTLREIPVWWVEAAVYYGRAQVAAGHLADGVACALAAVRRLPAPVHTVGIAVADLLTVVPAGYRSDDLDALRQEATGPGPWETLA